MARTVDLFDYLGPPLVLAGVSLIAYLVGILVTFSCEWRPVVIVLARWRRVFRSGEQTTSEYQRFLNEHLNKLYKGGQYSNWPAEYDLPDLSSAARVGNDDLRTRLLTANQGVFSEYDRLYSEAEFRLNVAVPLSVSLLLLCRATDAAWYWWGLVPVVAVALLQRGLVALDRSETVLQRAVLSGVIEHPLAVMATEHKSIEAEFVRQARNLSVWSTPSLEFSSTGFVSAWTLHVSNLNTDDPLVVTGVQQTFRLVRAVRFGGPSPEVLFEDVGPMETAATSSVAGAVTLPFELQPRSSLEVTGRVDARAPDVSGPCDPLVVAMVTFVDGHGRHWRRDANGELDRLASSGPRD